MPEICFAGPVGRIEGRYQQGEKATSPVVLILHPDPTAGGTMNNKVVYKLYQVFAKTGFTVLRINFPGVGKSEGKSGGMVDEFRVASAALDWLQHHNPEASHFWMAGFSFGSYIGMQLASRRPEIENFIVVGPPAKKYDFSFSVPCPLAGLVVQGAKDEIVSVNDVTNLVNSWSAQKNYPVEYEIIAEAGHFFVNELDELTEICENYINTSLAIRVSKPVRKKRRRRKKRDKDGDSDD